MSEPIFLFAEYDFIIDTNCNSKYFFKELCAYCIGLTNENEDCLEYADMFYLDMQIEDDDSPAGRIAEVKSPFFNCIRYMDILQNSESPCSQALNKRYGSIGEHEDEEYVLLTDENLDEVTGVAPLSVAIFFHDEPTQEQIQIIKERTNKFFNEVWLKLPTPKEKVEVEGFRLITRTTYGQETTI